MVEGECIRIRLTGEAGDGKVVSEAVSAARAGQAREFAVESEPDRVLQPVTIAALYELEEVCRSADLAFTIESLNPGIERLLNLAREGKKPDRRTADTRGSAVEAIGRWAVSRSASVLDVVTFVGECVRAFGSVLIGHGKISRREVLDAFMLCGPSSAGIVCLISGLTGLILAYIGSIQLEQFGAAIYVANLVGLGMVREMGAIMTGVIMAGRVGASFAARLGTMQVNEEIDALKTFGFGPTEYLVLPRIVAMILLMPFLTILADIIGVAGGVVIGVGVLHVPWLQYVTQTRDAMTTTDLFIGVVKGGVFGVLVAVTGCYQGIRCGRSAAAVGEAVTTAVVSGIVSIIVADAIFAIICNALDI